MVMDSAIYVTNSLVTRACTNLAPPLPAAPASCFRKKAQGQGCGGGVKVRRGNLYSIEIFVIYRIIRISVRLFSRRFFNSSFIL